MRVAGPRNDTPLHPASSDGIRISPPYEEAPPRMGPRRGFSSSAGSTGYLVRTIVRYTDEGSGWRPVVRPLTVATVAGSTPKRTNAPLPLLSDMSTVPGPDIRRVRSGNSP